MFVFRLNKIKITDNRERDKFFGLFRNRAEMRILSFVSTDDQQLPILDDLLKITDEVQQKKLVEQLVSQVINSRKLTEVKNIRDGQTLTFGDTGYSVYNSNTIPKRFDWLLTVIESDQDIRDNAKWASDVIKSPQFGNMSKELVTQLKSIGKVASVLGSPATAATMIVGKFAIDVLLESGKRNKDDQVGLLYMSLNRVQHYPFGKRDVQDVEDLTGNMKIDYSLFGVDDVDLAVADIVKSKKKKADTKKKTAKTKEKKVVK